MVQMEVSPSTCYPVPMPAAGQVTAQYEKLLELEVGNSTAKKPVEESVGAGSRQHDSIVDEQKTEQL